MGNRQDGLCVPGRLTERVPKAGAGRSTGSNTTAPIILLMHPAALDEDRLLAQCRLTTGRGSGPGGQHRNKVETAVRITHTPSGVHASATERRHKEQNRKQAVFRLRIKLAVQVREPIGPAAPPSALWVSRVKDKKLLINPGHDDFPALLAEAMDRLAAVHQELPAAASALGVSASQLIKLMKHEPAAFERLNAGRLALGLRTLH